MSFVTHQMVEFACRTAVAKSPLRGQSSGLSVSVQDDDVRAPGHPIQPTKRA